jgi:hypothetical protein
MFRGLFSSTLCAATIVALAFSSDPVAAQSPLPPPHEGPIELIITYRCPPPRRAAFRQFLSENGIQRFEHWKQDGMLTDYRFLLNWYVDVDSWDAMALLSFTSYAQVARWKEIERLTPGGLVRDVLEMAWPLNTASADLTARSMSADPQNPAASVYFVVPYDAASAGAFRDFTNATLIPQIKTWIGEGLVSYRVYSNRYPGGKRWQGLLVLEYRDMDAFSHAKSLPKDPRATERDSVMADAVVAH